MALARFDVGVIARVDHDLKAERPELRFTLRPLLTTLRPENVERQAVAVAQDERRELLHAFDPPLQHPLTFLLEAGIGVALDVLDFGRRFRPTRRAADRVGVDPEDIRPVVFDNLLRGERIPRLLQRRHLRHHAFRAAIERPRHHRDHRRGIALFNLRAHVFVDLRRVVEHMQLRPVALLDVRRA